MTLCDTGLSPNNNLQQIFVVSYFSTFVSDFEEHTNIHEQIQ